MISRKRQVKHYAKERKMKILHCFLMLIVLSALLPEYASAQSSVGGNASKSEWVFLGSRKTLAYKTLETGDKIMDFSHAGYMGGGVSLPSVPVKITVKPLSGDNTDNIQQAIDDVSKMEMVNGFRGAVLLAPGTFSCDRTIKLNVSGVLLRGSGSGENGSIINMTGKAHLCISVKGSPASEPAGPSTVIADAYVPSGTNSFNLQDARSFSVGDTIRITRPVTENWIKFMGMDDLVRDGKKQTWLSGTISTENVIEKTNGNNITLQVPLSDSYDARYLGAGSVIVEKIKTTGEITQVGIEDLRISAPGQSVTISQGHHRALNISGIRDAWVKDLEIFNTVNSVSITGKRISVDNVSIVHELPTIGAAKPADLNGSGKQILFNRCTIKGDNLFFFATSGKVSGPIVVLNSIFRGNGWIQPHMRWATGILIDGCEVPDGGIDFMNRGVMGSGHGWAVGWAVAWNCKAKTFLNQQPPGSANWVIGCSGEPQRRAIPFNKEPFLAEGIYDSHGAAVEPRSLYVSQLAERLGNAAVRNIGY